MIRFLVKVHNTEISPKICRFILALGSAALMEDKDPAHFATYRASVTKKVDKNRANN